MAYNIIASFFDIISSSLFDVSAVLMLVGFIIWELPRSVKIISEEYTRGVYPETGRVVDFVMLAVGIGALLFLMSGNVDKVVKYLKIPGITSVFIVLIVVLPLIISLGFFKRLFSRMDHHNSVTVFIVQGMLDLAHTIFFIALVILSIPVIGFLLFGPR
jgi:hypothetical protein